MNKKMQTSQWEHYFNSLKTTLETNPNIDIDLIQKAFYFAGDAHSAQYRRSGEPYIMHPTAVAKIVAEQGLGIESIIAAFLHDTVEDTKVSLQDIIDTFGKDVAFLVDSLSHFDNTLKTTDKKDVQTLRKILFSMSKDFRTVYIKIADRLHNMSTLKHMPPEKQIKKAIETQKIYIGLAKNLNLWKWKTALENHCFKYLEPQRYKIFDEKINAANRHNEKIQNIIKTLKNSLTPSSLKSLTAHKYSTLEIANELKREDSFIDINNIYFIEILSSGKKAYENLSSLHSSFKSFDTRFKDYLSKPKENGYNAIHTTIFTDFGLIDIKIKNEDSFSNSQKYNEKQWVEKILLREKNLKDDSIFHNSIVGEVLSDSITVYSSHGEEINIPQNSTVLDFLLLLYGKRAFLVGNVYIQDKLVSLDYNPTHKDILEVLFTSTTSSVRLDWFSIVTSYEAKQILINELGGEQNFESLMKGYEEFKYWEKVFDISSLDYIYKYYEKYLQPEYDSFEKALIAIGNKTLTTKEFVSKLIPITIFSKSSENSHNFALKIKDIDSTYVEQILEIMSKLLKKNLPKHISDIHYVSYGENSIIIRYFFSDMNDLLSFLFEIKQIVSKNIKIKYTTSQG
ncbi:MAG: Bifunctional (P)ppGpp synthetase/guanosine-3',5'-bis(Diphosphate) 3'-pyrophosphohydrolase [uncultured Campylobacterales bacterium]|uniref:Bifunctional (P)ppGpp synthetase/guanosine-3',5'-bis(Diphosphate) 3'-pyrophosphohydrolase n=1 Tax=uncultured Campylobacterales bacterium TaxID=352960 RepID=A0A6S6SFZ3_9BACT|nr:MAG: Bifunctional (P)ppGpp synthetase/guanosine-3',5'-bis(Diphosphate) 3'-pyrophosphohydrolase [uncultured Campylobacterales bacterium]